METVGTQLDPVPFRVTGDAVRAYCEATGHPQMAGSEADQSPAPPTLASVYTYGLVAQLRAKEGAILAGQSFRFLQPVREGDELRTDGVIIERFEKRGRQFMVLETETRNQQGDLVCSGRLTRILPDAPSGEA